MAYQEDWNKEAINLMTLLTDNDINDACTIRPQFDNTNGTVNNTDGDFAPEYRMFVDNLLSAIPRHLRKTRHFIASSIESVYILLRYPGPITKPDLPPTKNDRQSSGVGSP